MSAVSSERADGSEAPELDRASIARIVVIAGAQTVSRGTGTLIGPRLVVSALHVVANRTSDPPAPYPGEIRLEFPGFTTAGTILPNAWDAKLDWVLIECAEEPPGVTPMPVASLNENKREWESFGFPDANATDGLLLSGNVMMCKGQLLGTSAHQLYCEQAAAGAGGRVKGMSGAPVVIGGHLIGIMRFALMEQDRTEMGTLYACPVGAVAQRWPTLGVVPLPKLVRKDVAGEILEAQGAQAGWALAAIAGSLLIIAATIVALSQIRVPTTTVEGSVYAEDVQFRLPKEAPMLVGVNNGLLRVASLDATELESASLPASDGRRTSLATRTLHLEPVSGSATANRVGLDFSTPLPNGARVWLHASKPRYRIRVDSAQVPLRSSFEGTVRAGPDASSLKSYSSATGDSVLLVPLGGRTIIAEMSLLTGDEALLSLGTTFPVRRLGFYATETDAGPPTRAPKIIGGELTIDGTLGGAKVPMKLGDSLAFDADELTVKGIRFPAGATGGVEIKFFGTVTQLTVGTDDVAVNLMPTWLGRIRRRYAAAALVVAAAAVAFLAFLIIRWRRRSA